MWYNPIIKTILKSPFNWLVGNQMMLLTYTGHKSGQTYETPISYVELDNDSNEHSLLTISKATRTWWRNFRGGANVTLRLRGKNRKAHAQTSEGGAAYPDLMLYMQKSPAVAKSLGVGLDTDRKLLTEDVRKLCENWVIVRFTLE